jgi:3,4-dihydroxy-9,10-secoandrosta-1,3,5(10)-triene-9,17-dione 4,5-dioxygenase
MAVKALAYITAETAKIDEWKTYATNILGVQIAEKAPAGTLGLRLDDRPFRYVLREGKEERFGAAGLTHATKKDFDETIQKLERAGVRVEKGSAADAKAMFVEELVRTADPAGNKLELVWGCAETFEPFLSPQGVTGFLTGEMGLGHVVFPSNKVKETHDFYQELLGFGDSDEARLFMSPNPEDPPVSITFMHADNPRHHTVAFGDVPAPTGLIHTMLEAKTIDDVGRCYDRALNAGIKIAASLGRHVNDHMLSFYMHSPSGWVVEFGCMGTQFDWSTFTPTISHKDSHWGHRWGG